jgi:hypothetical protein
MTSPKTEIDALIERMPKAALTSAIVVVLDFLEATSADQRNARKVPLEDLEPGHQANHR